MQALYLVATNTEQTRVNNDYCHAKLEHVALGYFWKLAGMHTP